MEQKREVECVSGCNTWHDCWSSLALIWALTSQRALKFDLHFSSVKANKHNYLASLCSWAKLWNKEAKLSATASTGYKEGSEVRAAVWGVKKGGFAPCSLFQLGFVGPAACLRHGVLARALNYFEFWFWKLALNLIPFKWRFTWWERNLFKL